MVNAINLDEFFLLYEKHCVERSELKDFKPKIERQINELDDGPPCLATLMSQGIPEGGRDNTLYQYAVYAKKKMA